MAMIGKLEKDIRVVLQFYHFNTNLILTTNLKNISKFNSVYSWSNDDRPNFKMSP